MAVFQTYQTVGIREDLADIIYSISPTETPFMSGVAKEQATNTTHEWQTDSLADVAANASVEGASISYPTLSATTKLTNHTQISTKAIQVSGTNDAVTSAGRNNELAYQVAKSSKELKRDMETALLSNVAAAAGNATTARKSGGVQTWISSNVSAGSGGSGGSGGGCNENSNGTANSGGGGGGNTGGSGSAGTGGSGVVILRYPSDYTVTVGAGLTSSTATDGLSKVTTFTAGTGTVSFA